LAVGSARRAAGGGAFDDIAPAKAALQTTGGIGSCSNHVHAPHPFDRGPRGRPGAARVITAIVDIFTINDRVEITRLAVSAADVACPPAP
jgi:hypothetical protein